VSKIYVKVLLGLTIVLILLLAFLFAGPARLFIG
jgi:hypothetical protein